MSNSLKNKQQQQQQDVSTHARNNNSQSTSEHATDPLISALSSLTLTSKDDLKTSADHEQKAIPATVLASVTPVLATVIHPIQQKEEQTSLETEKEKTPTKIPELHRAEPVVSSAAASIPLSITLPASFTGDGTQTGIVYDPLCALHRANYAHVESPQRITETFSTLTSNGLVAECVHIPSRTATDTELLLTHPVDHVQRINDTATRVYATHEEVDSEDESHSHATYPDCHWLDNDTYVNQHSSLSARLSCGSLIDLAGFIAAGALKNGFAVIRPPGHHADHRSPQGFCLYNNVAVCVNSLLQHPSLPLQRICIVDWDVHHGNGTQNLFYDKSSVLYFSIHRYQHASFYPHTGSAEEVGVGAGVGYNINMPLNTKGLGDREYLQVWETLLLPVIRQYQPQLIVVSAGFDCAEGDPLGGMAVTPVGFAHLTRHLATIPMTNTTTNNNLTRTTTASTTASSSPPKCIPVLMALEGGYNTTAVAASVSACVSALLGHPVPSLTHTDGNHATTDSLPPLPSPAQTQLSHRDLKKQKERYAVFCADLAHVLHLQKRYWNLPIAAAAGAPAPAPAATSPSIDNDPQYTQLLAAMKQLSLKSAGGSQTRTSQRKNTKHRTSTEAAVTKNVQFAVAELSASEIAETKQEQQAAAIVTEEQLQQRQERQAERAALTASAIQSATTITDASSSSSSASPSNIDSHTHTTKGNASSSSLPDCKMA